MEVLENQKEKDIVPGKIVRKADTSGPDRNTAGKGTG